MKVVSVSEENVRKAASMLASSGLVISSTDSVYGLFCDALNEMAVERVKQVKSRELGKPLQVAVRKEDAGKYGVIHPNAQKIIERFWPGDVNIIVKKRGIIPDFISKETVCLTCHPNLVAAKLIELSGKPLVSTSANFSGESPPTRASEINPKLIELVDLVLDGGETKNKKPNTILDLTKKPAVILREGAISKKELEQILAIK